MKKTTIIVQARMAASRLPGKVLLKLAGKPVLQHVIERCKSSKATEILVATSTNQENDKIEEFCKNNSINCFRGSEDDVLDRYYQLAKQHNAKTIIRITGDCPLIDPNVINELIDEFNSEDYDYISNVLERTFPRGLDTEIFSFEALEKAHSLATEKPHREHVTAFIYAHPEIFKIKNITAKADFNRPDIRLTLDTKEDLEVLTAIFNNFTNAQATSTSNIINFLDKSPGIKILNNKSELEQANKNKEEGIKQNILDEKSIAIMTSRGLRKIGPGNPTFIIAELSCNHLQDYDLAVKTIKSMKESGAEAVKLQTYTPDTITIESKKDDFLIKQGTPWDGKMLHDLYKKAYTPWHWIPKLKDEVENLDMICISSAFDKTAVDFLEDVNIPMHKIASFEITDIPLIKYTASKGKPILISTGIAEYSDIEKAVEACRGVGNDNIILLKCTSAYPTPHEEANLKTIPDLNKQFGVISGLSDHTLGISSPVAAVALGASIIEKHFILDRNLKDKDGDFSPDKEFSLEPHEFKEMVESVRSAEKALGIATYQLTEIARRGRDFSRSLYVVEDIKAGEAFTEKNIRSIRPGFGLHPENIEKIIGKKASKDIEKGSRMDWDLVQ